MHNNRTKKSSKGFTLLELLIAIALMDIIALTLYSSMYIGFRTKTITRRTLKPYQTVLPAFEFIRKDLSNALKPDGILAGVFVGEDVSWRDRQDADMLSFYSCGYYPDEEDETASNVVNIAYVLEQDAERGQVVLKRLMTKNLLSPSTVEPEEEVICRGLAGFDIQYFDGSSWLENWDSSSNDQTLPWGVQVTLTIFEEEKNRSPQADDDGYRNFKRIFMLPFANQEAQEGGGAGLQQNG